MRVDPHIVAAWIKGWTLARETAPPTPYKGGFRVDVGWPEQKARYVLPAIVPTIGELASAINEPWIFLKACASPDAMQPILATGWAIQRPGYMMTLTRPMGDFERPKGYVLDTAEGPISIVRALDRAGETAAIGRVVAADGFAIYDRIETRAEHRRRGLARAVMLALEAIGRKAGAARGVLVATPDGRALYESLGWELHSPYTTAVIPAD